MVQDFKACGGKGGAVFLGVQGGRTSEGVDFPGNQMNSVIVVGVPYAEPTPRVKAQIDYYDKRFPGFGREYGYILPAMKKASQAAGQTHKNTGGPRRNRLFRLPFRDELLPKLFALMDNLGHENSARQKRRFSQRNKQFLQKSVLNFLQLLVQNNFSKNELLGLS